MKNKFQKILLYPVTIESCEEGGFFAKCLTLQGCHAEGKTYAETLKNIEDVIKTHLEIRKKHDEFTPSVVLEYNKSVSINLPILIKA